MNNNKVKKDLLKEYISFLPKDYKIENETAKKVFAVLYFYSKMNEHQPFTIGQRTIAEDAMLSQMTVSRSMNVLIEKYKYVECKKGHLKHNSTYQILPPSIETSMNKNDMFQQDPMFQQNVSTKMIHDVSINTTDNEEVTLNQKTQMFQCDSEGKKVDQMFHNYNNNNNLNLKYNTNIVEISNIDRLNKSIDNKEKVKKEMATQIEEKLLERIEVMENNQEKMATLLDRLLEKSTLPTSTNFEEKENEEVENLKSKLSQLEETVEKQAEEITHLNERLDKAGKAFLQLRNSIKSTTSTSTPTQVEEKTTYTTQPTYSNDYSKEKGEYVKAIKAFYDFKREGKIDDCQKMVETLNKLAQTGKLSDYQLQKIEKCEEVLGESERHLRRYTKLPEYPTIRLGFSDLQYKFYAILKRKDFSEEDFKKLTKVVKEIEEIDHLPNEKFDKIIDIYTNLLAKDPERKKAYFTEYYAYRQAFRTMLGKGEDEELIYQLCQKYSEYLLTFRQVPREILRKAGLEEVLLYSKGCWSDEVIRWKWNYEQKASTSLQKEESGTTDHTEEENVSERLKTTKNEVLTDVNTTEISETKVEEPETTKEEVKNEVVENSPVSLENVEDGTTTQDNAESLSEGLKSGKNKELTSVNSAYNPPIRIEEGRSTLFVPLNSTVSEDDLIAKMLGGK